MDRFFRTFSGHTQVNASDLRSLRFPDGHALRALARSTARMPAQDELDGLIDRVALVDRVAPDGVAA